MNQRQSISFTPPPKKYDLAGNFAIALFLGRHMILSGLAATPIQFINKNTLEKGLTEAYEYAFKLDGNNTDDVATKIGIIDMDLMPLKSADLTETMSTLNILSIKELYACVVTFKDTNNCLLVVGTNREFYIIDIANNIFYETSYLEYDIDQYKYGSTNFDVLYVSRKKEKENEKQPTTKKLKTTTTTVKKEKEKQ